MNEICANCGKPKNEHGDCNFCPGNTSVRYMSSGRVSVPVEFVEEVKKACVDFAEYTGTSVSYFGYGRIRLKARKSIASVNSMLTEIEKGGGV